MLWHRRRRAGTGAQAIEQPLAGIHEVRALRLRPEGGPEQEVGLWSLGWPDSEATLSVQRPEGDTRCSLLSGLGCARGVG